RLQARILAVVAGPRLLSGRDRLRRRFDRLRRLLLQIVELRQLLFLEFQFFFQFFALALDLLEFGEPIALLALLFLEQHLLLFVALFLRTLCLLGLFLRHFGDLLAFDRVVALRLAWGLRRRLGRLRRLRRRLRRRRFRPRRSTRLRRPGDADE